MQEGSGCANKRETEKDPDGDELLCILTVVVDIQATQDDKIAQNLHTLKKKR